MDEHRLEIAVIIVAYNSRGDLPGCLAGRDHWARESVRVHTVVVDCGSTDGSAELIRERFSDIHLVDPKENLGFAGGNNAGWDYIRTELPGTKYVALLNPDTAPTPNWLDPLIERLEHHPSTATCQPLVTLYDSPDRINTAGNQSHFLGFGLITGYNRPVPDDVTPSRIGYSSGAAMLIRADLLNAYGLFDSRMFLYCEDTDLGWKLSQLGHHHELVPASRVAHRYDPRASMAHYYYLERNRLRLLWVYYKRPTLILMLPAMLLMEFGQLMFALVLGRLKDKSRSWGYFLNRESRQHVMAQRKAAQDRRTVCDRDFIQYFTGTIDHPAINSPLVRYIANPILGVYWWLARRVIFW